MQTSAVVKLVFLSLLITSFTHAQQKRQPVFDHSLTAGPQRPPFEKKSSGSVSLPETTNVLVAMVEFQTDNNPGTTGDGTFDMGTISKIVDPPPHDKAYVQNHMTFLENYFRKVSDGKQIIKTTVLDSVYRVHHDMAYYSPARSSTNNGELAKLVEDAWRKVDSVSPGIPYDQYQAFIILHAGVGRDVNLVSLYGYDPAPYDLPSLFFNLNALQNVFGSSYQGVPVRDSTMFIRNSAIIPETENRYLPVIGGTALLPLGINGLLAASMGSFFGLPDLFDTKTGRSGIGRFGLMDGQSIFSWNGLFPPEPSAWEKYFLGWIDPITVSLDDATYPFPAVSSNNQDTVYRVPITAKEYFLVENRNRDANRDGAGITIAYNGNNLVRSWARDTIGFNALFQDSLYGVVTDVDEFDWSLPGGVLRGEWFDGGILIWHIDENVIDANYATDAVNVNSEHRGVNLEEADGSQDIGQAYPFLTAGYGSEDGTQYDYWYAGNQSPLRLLPNGNAFTPASQPGSMSNNRANSHIYIDGFSARGPRMTARIRVGDAEVKPLTGFPKYTGRTFGKNSITLLDSSGTSQAGLIVSTEASGPGSHAIPNGQLVPAQGPSKLFGWKLDGSPLLPDGNTTGLLTLATGTVGSFFGKVAITHDQGAASPRLAIGGVESGVFIPTQNGINVENYVASSWDLADANHDTLVDQYFRTYLANRVTTSPVVSDSFIVFGATQGFVYLLRHDGTLADSVKVNSSDTSDISSVSLLANPGSFIATTSNGTQILIGLACVAAGKSASISVSGMQAWYTASGTISATIGKQVVLASHDGEVTLITPCSLTGSYNAKGFPVATGGEIENAPALADIDDDGQKEIVVFSGNKIYVINAVGAILDNFPITVPSSNNILTSPIVADVDGNGTNDIVAVTQEGLVVAYDKHGKMAAGFPIQAGINRGSTPAVFYIPSPCLSCYDIGLAVASDDGNVYAWHTGTLNSGPLPAQKMPWPQFMHDAQNTGLNEELLTTKYKTQDFFPPSMAYNWPNPVGPEHGFKTHIRYFVRENAKVTITIFDLAGDLVTSFPGPGTGGLDNEIEWNVSNIQSGIYFAHIDAQGTNATGATVIKIAVVK